MEFYFLLWIAFGVGLMGWLVALVIAIRNSIRLGRIERALTLITQNSSVEK